MASVLLLGGRTCLVTVLWVAVLTTATGWSASASPPSDFGEHFLAFIAEAVGVALEPVVTSLNRHDCHEQLVGRLDNLTSELAKLSAQLSGRADRQDIQLEALADQLTGLSSVLSNESSSLSNGSIGVHPAIVRDCSDLPAGSSSGVHVLQLGVGQRQVPTFCDLDHDGGNWTVIQRRADIEPRQDFYLGWEEYKWGLGEISGEFWWGLENVWNVTSAPGRRYELRVDLEDFDGQKRHALYQDFKISGEDDGYRLSLGTFSGDAGDSMTRGSGMKFSTKDRDQDSYSGHCARMYKGAWWYEECHLANLNGLYLSGDHSSYANGVNWRTWKGYHYSLKNVEMKIRPM